MVELRCIQCCNRCHSDHKAVCERAKRLLRAALCDLELENRAEGERTPDMYVTIDCRDFTRVRTH